MSAVDNGLRQWCPRCLKATPTITDGYGENRCAECPDRMCDTCARGRCESSRCQRRTCLCPCTTYIDDKER